MYVDLPEGAGLFAAAMTAVALTESGRSATTFDEAVSTSQ
jgi:hypothetical protein